MRSKRSSCYTMLGTPGQQYKPTCVAEIKVFNFGYCQHCIKSKAEGEDCPIRITESEWPVTESRLPNEWRYDNQGRPACSEFLNGRVLKVVEPETGDLFRESR